MCTYLSLKSCRSIVQLLYCLQASFADPEHALPRSAQTRLFPNQSCSRKASHSKVPAAKFTKKKAVSNPKLANLKRTLIKQTNGEFCEQGVIIMYDNNNLYLVSKFAFLQLDWLVDS